MPDSLDYKHFHKPTTNLVICENHNYKCKLQLKIRKTSNKKIYRYDSTMLNGTVVQWEKRKLHVNNSYVLIRHYIFEYNAQILTIIFMNFYY